MTRRLALGGTLRSEWERLGTVESDSEPGVEHVIEQLGVEVRRCDCLAFRFARGKLGTPGKTCKHIGAWTLGIRPGTMRATVDQFSVKAGTRETFTVRRAFDFGNQ